MAEILISLTIIGIIAAITLPSLVGNINEKTWAAQRKALHSRMSQALSMMPSMNGYGIGATTEETNANAAKIFVTDGLSKVLKINNICDSTNLNKCDLPDKINPINGSKFVFPKNLSDLHPMFTSTYTDGNGSQWYNPQHEINTNVAAFETENGVSAAVFYNPLCQVDMGEETKSYYVQTKMCVNFIYDLNGRKGPNKVGRDVGFITALYPVDVRVVAPMPLASNAKSGTEERMKQKFVAGACRTQDKNSRAPNKDEITAMFYNSQLIGTGIYNESTRFWAGSVYSSDMAWNQSFLTGRQQIYNRNNTSKVRCVKR